MGYNYINRRRNRLARVLIMISENRLLARNEILTLEQEMKSSGKEIDIEVNHYFCDGLYAREMIMPKGVIVVGKIHKKEHFCVISKGIVEIRSEEKSERVESPFIYTSMPGAKRALYAIEDVVWTTFHATTETDLDKLEAEHIAENFDELLDEESGNLVLEEQNETN